VLAVEQMGLELLCKHVVNSNKVRSLTRRLIYVTD